MRGQGCKERFGDNGHQRHARTEWRTKERTGNEGMKGKGRKALEAK
jgi:hypothetical protein